VVLAGTIFNVRCGALFTVTPSLDLTTQAVGIRWGDQELSIFAGGTPVEERRQIARSYAEIATSRLLPPRGWVGRHRCRCFSLPALRCRRTGVENAHRGQPHLGVCVKGCYGVGLNPWLSELILGGRIGKTAPGRTAGIVAAFCSGEAISSLRLADKYTHSVEASCGVSTLRTCTSEVVGAVALAGSATAIMGYQ
jgi:hypothetical protein